MHSKLISSSTRSRSKLTDECSSTQKNHSCCWDDSMADIWLWAADEEQERTMQNVGWSFSSTWLGRRLPAASLRLNSAPPGSDPTQHLAKKHMAHIPCVFNVFIYLNTLIIMIKNHVKLFMSTVVWQQRTCLLALILHLISRWMLIVLILGWIHICF